MRNLVTVVFVAALAAPVLAQTHPGEAAFRATYKELVETNTAHSTGSCTLAAERMAARLTAAGYATGDLHRFAVPEAPKDGGLVVVLPGSDPKAKAVLLLAHLDVVEAKASDWTRDPFTLIEESGYFYARGASDDKAMASIFVDAMARLHVEPRMRRTLKLALTCGEETTGVFNGAEYLATHERGLIDAGFALNEGGGGRLGPDGKPLLLAIQVSEKTSQNYTLEAKNPGGHSSMPRPDNAINELAAALTKIAAYHFPVKIDATTGAFWTRMARIAPPPVGGAMAAIADNPTDASAEAMLARDPLFNSTLRTTCVATLLEAGHAENALPQHAQANINCRIFPGDTIAGTRDRLTEVIANPAISVTSKSRRGPPSSPAPLDPAVLGPAERLGAEMYPGVPLIPVMSTGASDSIYLAAAGIPSYGVPGIFYDADSGNIHGLNERIRVKSVLDGRDYLFRLIRTYADAK